MSRMTKEINKITGTIISISGKLIIYAVLLLLLFEGTTKGYEFGHEIFFATAVDEGAGIEKTVAIPRGQSTAETAHMLKQSGLIVNELAFQVQKKFYDYDINPGMYQLNTAMTSKEILQLLDEETETTEESKPATSQPAEESSDATDETPAESVDDLNQEDDSGVDFHIDGAEGGGEG